MLHPLVATHTDALSKYESIIASDFVSTACAGDSDRDASSAPKIIAVFFIPFFFTLEF
jgi:hypothetical protein